MPLYEYQCEACGQRFEKIQKFSDPPLEVCEKCGKGPVQKLLSTPAIQFKGSGWYITDYASGRSSAASSTSTTEPKSQSGGDSGASDATTGKAAKSDTPAAPAAPATPAKKD